MDNKNSSETDLSIFKEKALWIQSSHDSPSSCLRFTSLDPCLSTCLNRFSKLALSKSNDALDVVSKG